MEEVKKAYFYLMYLIFYFSISVLFSYCRLYIFLVTRVSDCICIRLSISRDTSLVVTKPGQQGEIGAITYIDYIVKSQHEHIVQYKRESKPGKPYNHWKRISNKKVIRQLQVSRYYVHIACHFTK